MCVFTVFTNVNVCDCGAKVNVRGLDWHFGSEKAMIGRKTERLDYTYRTEYLFEMSLYQQQFFALKILGFDLNF